jgi:alcohol dehydrogenase
VLDLLPREANASQVRAAAMTVRPGGRVVLMGGVGRPGGAGGSGAIAGDFALPYPWLMRNDITVRGKYMYPRDAVARMVRLVRAGLIDLSQFDLTEFALDAVNDAVAFAAGHAGPLRLTVLRPDQ